MASLSLTLLCRRCLPQTKCIKIPFQVHSQRSKLVTSSVSPSTPPETKSSPTKTERENILTVPNLLCVSRIAASPVIAQFLVNNEFKYALALFGYAGLTDLVDGWIARNFKGQMSSLGSFLDPLADKILVTVMFLSLSYVDLIPAALTSLVVSRDVLLVYAGMYIRYMSVQKPVRSTV